MKFILLIVTWMLSLLDVYSQQWIRDSALPNSTKSVCINPLNNNTIFVSTSDSVLFRTYNGGHTWQQIPLPYQVTNSIFIAPADTNVIIAFPGNNYPLDFGVQAMRSKNQGKDWVRMRFPVMEATNSEDMNYWVVSESVVADNVNPSILYATVMVGNRKSKREVWLCKSKDNGDEWSVIFNSKYMFPELKIYSFDSFAINSSGSLFVVGDGCFILASMDKGITWKLVRERWIPNWGRSNAASIRFSKIQPEVGFITTTVDDKRKTGGILKTVDSGKTWSQIAFPDTSYWGLDLIEETNNSTILIGGYHVNKIGYPNIQQSTNFGKTWKRIDTKETAWQCNTCYNVYSIKHIKNRNGDLIYYLATGSGLFTYNPNGTTSVYSEEIQNEVTEHNTYLPAFIQHIRLRSDIERVDIYSITGERLFSFDTMHDGEHIDRAIQELSQGTYYAIATTTKGKHEYQSLIQYQ